MLGRDEAVTGVGQGLLEVDGLTAEQVGDLAALDNIALHELTRVQASLEEAFMELTREDVEYRSASPAARPEPELAA